MAAPLPGAFVEAVTARLPPDTFTQDPAQLAEYGRDWTRVLAPDAGGLALPRSTREVATLVGLCAAHRVGVVPSGGRTGYAAGAVAARGELILSLQRMRRMDAVDVLGN